MPDKLPVGPYRTVEIDNGVQARSTLFPLMSKVSARDL